METVLKTNVDELINTLADKQMGSIYTFADVVSILDMVKIMPSDAALFYGQLAIDIAELRKEVNHLEPDYSTAKFYIRKDNTIEVDEVGIHTEYLEKKINEIAAKISTGAYNVNCVNSQNFNK